MKPRWLLWGGLLLILAWLLLKGWRIYGLVHSLQTQQTAVADLTAGGLGDVDLAQAADIVLGVRRDVVALREEVAIFLPLTPYLSWLPTVGPLMPAAPALLEMADAGTATAALLTEAVRPALVGNSPSAALPAILNQLAAEPERVAQAQTNYGRVLAARGRLGDTSQWPFTAQQLLRQFDQLSELGTQGLALTPVLADLAGSTDPRTYLVIAQNQEELRATGGFISGAGLLTVQDGRIVSLNFSDAYTVDDWANKPYDFPPQALYQFMGLELFLFRDANFWPDFPTSAAKLSQLYTYGTGIPVDGVIAFDQQFLALLVQGLGSVAIPELELTLTPANLEESLRQSWATGNEGEDWLATRKSFMGPMAAAIRQRLENEWADLDLPALANQMGQALRQKHVQIYVPRPATAAVLRQIGWDGHLSGPTTGDVLAVVESNMGFNKANILVERAYTYAVTLGDQPTAALTISYTHTSTTNQPCNPQIPSYQRGLQYEALVDRCYWNYVRIYAPQGAVLQTADQFPAPAAMFLHGQAWAGQPWSEVDTAQGVTIFHNFLLLQRGQTLPLRTTYTLPTQVVQATADGQQYQLTVHQQAGQKPSPLTVQITLPAGQRLLAAVPTPTHIQGQVVEFQTTLAEDETFVVTFGQ